MRMSRAKLIFGLFAVLGMAGMAAYQLWHVAHTGRIFVSMRLGFKGYATFAEQPWGFVTAVLICVLFVLLLAPYVLLNFPWWRFSKRPTIWGNAERPWKRVSSD